jgi:hypothetical protein
LDLAQGKGNLVALFKQHQQQTNNTNPSQQFETNIAQHRAVSFLVFKQIIFINLLFFPQNKKKKK